MNATTPNQTLVNPKVIGNVNVNGLNTIYFLDSDNLIINADNPKSIVIEVSQRIRGNESYVNIDVEVNY